MCFIEICKAGLQVLSDCSAVHQVRPGQSVALPPQIFNSGRYCGVGRPQLIIVMHDDDTSFMWCMLIWMLCALFYLKDKPFEV